MATIGRRWVRSFCPCCAQARSFTLEPGWVIRCPHCGYERGLHLNPDRPRRRELVAAG